jgi:hypothetical protein
MLPRLCSPSTAGVLKMDDLRSAEEMQGDGSLVPELLDNPIWTDELVADAGLPVHDVPFVTIGGGLGSFAMVDYLRIAGIPVESIRVLTLNDLPHRTYEQLCRFSQIPAHERLRSDSSSTMDNIWGFPSYALREAWEDHTVRPLWNVLVEPVLADFWTPRSQQVYRSVEREGARIGWSSMLVGGLARVVRRRHGGGYFTVLTPPPGRGPTQRVTFRSRFVHLAVGYPALKFLPDLQRYREEHDDPLRVVNAYESHEHVYNNLRARPGTVLVRGSGIVASRILQRLIDDRDHHGAETTILHLFRNYVAEPQGESIFARRPGHTGFAYQGFNVAKAAWGGQLRDKLLTLEGEERAELIGRIGGTNTPRRKLWQEQIRRGIQQGFYRQFVGEVEDITPTADGMIRTRIRAKDGASADLSAAFIIDATGLEGNPLDNRLLGDLVEHSGAGLNPLRRLDVEPTGEIRGTRSGEGRMYASGSATAGGYYAGVDSFLGLQYVAQQICDDLATVGFGRRIGVGRSTSQWIRWMRNVAP